MRNDNLISLMSVVHEIGKSLNTQLVDYFVEKSLFAMILDGINSLDQSHHETIALIVEYIYSLLKESSSHGTLLLNDFTMANGYSTILNKLLECTEAFSTDEEMMVCTEIVVMRSAICSTYNTQFLSNI